MNYFALLFPALVPVCPAEVPPAHIVQDLPPELDPRLAPPFVPPTHIVRDLNASETAACEAAMAPIDRNRLDGDMKQAVEEYAVQESAVDQQMSSFFIHAKVATPAAKKPEAAASGSEQTPEAAGEDDLTRVTCADGLYFDMEQGVAVFMRDVKVRGEEMSLDCDNELKIFALRDESKKKKKKGEPETKESDNEPELAQIDFNFSLKKPRLITASGNVVVKLKDKNGKQLAATGDKLTYNGVTGETILTGGDLSLTRDNVRVAVAGPDAFVRIYEDGNAYIKGRRVDSQATGLKAMQQKNKK